MRVRKSLLAVASCLSFVVVLCGSTTSHAEWLGYEGFGYSPIGSQLLGDGGGSGFTGNWFASGFNVQTSTNYVLADDSLDDGTLSTSGNRVHSDTLSIMGGIARHLANPIVANQTTTRYFSFLLRPEGALSGGNQNSYFGLYLDGTANNGYTDLFIGKAGGGTMDKYVLEDRGGTNQVASNASVVLNQTTFLVLKAEFNVLSSPDRFTLYANPNPFGVEPASGTIKTMADIGAVNDLVIYSTGAFSIDEIRVGMTYADVAPVPEPSAIVLLATSAFSLLAYAWRRRV